jgi:hypothetical protein
VGQLLAPDRFAGRANTSREGIVELVLLGQIAAATSLCNSHFPRLLEAAPGTFLNLASSTSSLKSSRHYVRTQEADDPSARLWSYSKQPSDALDADAHGSPAPTDRILSLDLSIQEVIESVRLVSRALSESRSASMDIVHGATNGSEEASSKAHSSDSSSSSAFALSSALSQAQALYAIAGRIVDTRQKAFYQKLLEEVSGLLIYTDLDSSPVAHFLDLQRRQELAHRLHGAMLGNSKEACAARG